MTNGVKNIYSKKDARYVIAYAIAKISARNYRSGFLFGLQSKGHTVQAKQRNFTKKPRHGGAFWCLPKEASFSIMNCSRRSSPACARKKGVVQKLLPASRRQVGKRLLPPERVSTAPARAQNFFVPHFIFLPWPASRAFLLHIFEASCIVPLTS